MEPGDVVQLKSGGPALTVLSEDGDKVRCLYFADELGEFREIAIPAFALESIEMEDEEEEDGDEKDDEDKDDEADDERA